MGSENAGVFLRSPRDLWGDVLLKQLLYGARLPLQMLALQATSQRNISLCHYHSPLVNLSPSVFKMNNIYISVKFSQCQKVYDSKTIISSYLSSSHGLPGQLLLSVLFPGPGESGLTGSLYLSPTAILSLGHVLTPELGTANPGVRPSNIGTPESRLF